MSDDLTEVQLRDRAYCEFRRNIDRDIDDTQAELAMRFLGVDRINRKRVQPLKPYDPHGGDWRYSDFWGAPHYFQSVAEYERWKAFCGNPAGIWFPD